MLICGNKCLLKKNVSCYIGSSRICAFVETQNFASPDTYNIMNVNKTANDETQNFASLRQHPWNPRNPHLQIIYCVLHDIYPLIKFVI